MQIIRVKCRLGSQIMYCILHIKIYVMEYVIGILKHMYSTVQCYLLDFILLSNEGLKFVYSLYFHRTSVQYQSFRHSIKLITSLLYAYACFLSPNMATKGVDNSCDFIGKNGFCSRQETNGFRKSVELSSLNGLIREEIHGSTKKKGLPPVIKESFEQVPLYTAIMTYLGFYLLMFLGWLNQLFFTPKVAKEKNRDGYVPLYDRFESFYLRYVYRRVRDCWNTPICSVPGAEVVLKDRITKDYGWTFEFTGTETKCLNLGSYNYMDFAETSGSCTTASIGAIRSFGCALCSPVQEIGTNPLIVQLEKLTAEFVGTEDAIVFGMGFATNALNIPSLLGPGCLVVSDEKNHASIILGLRLSGATIKVFKHNNMPSLERAIRAAIVHGQPRTHRPWKKILIVVEGIYSMEGSILRLPELLEIKKKYKAYLYVDEAHSVGALGGRGRGVADYYGCNPRDIDILMGTFTKSFASAGGFIAGSKKLIDYLRVNSHAACYASSMSPPIAMQIISSMSIIMGKDGTSEGIRRVRQLAHNVQYFRKRLKKIGVITYGNEDSPIVPLLVYMFSKIGAVVRTLRQRKIAVVGVGFPASPLMEGRIRFCLSAGHTKEMLDYALDTIEEIADTLGLRYSQKPRPTEPIIYGSDDELE